MIQKQLTRDAEGMREVNLTPLIDVCLVLVTILLLATPMTFESNLAVREARASAAEDDSPSEGKPVLLRVFSEDSLEVDGTRMARKNLRVFVKPILEAHASTRVVLTCEDFVTHGAFVDVLDQTKRAGAEEIAVAGR